MTKTQHEALIKFNQVSQQREICNEKAKRVRRFRNLAIITFIVSVALIVVYQFAMHSTILQPVKIDELLKIVPGKEYLFLLLGILSFVLLLVSVFKSINAELDAEKARKIEGLMAQKAFSLMLIKTN
ncbi:MAG: hypothetical protein JXR31_01330 [Prolixibacteraceae bacterium]|nr:hypothetical protein [Prolixibacteraceae bacterium]MBN2772859.1 hypothetical protein [Prolixibacteraceae bacterium]